MELFEPGKIGRLSVKNRIVMSAMGIGALAEPDGRLSQRGIDYYAARAKGGVGLIITGAAYTQRMGQLPSAPLGSDLVIDGRLCTGRLSELAEAIHDHGGKVAVQLFAGLGRIAGTETLRRGGAVAPSALPCFFDPNVMARELTTKEVERLTESFEFAAEVVSIAGIDAIELNCHSEYLADEFMTALWNKRTDKYGGDLDGRLKFLMEIIERIKKAAGADFPIIVKYGLTHYLEGGREIEEGLEIARRLEGAGVAALDIDAGGYKTLYWAKPPTTQPPGCMVDLAEMTKEVVNIPIIAVGKLGYPELAEKVLQQRKADFIALGRALLADPEWPNKVKEGRLQDICPCIGDHEGCSGRVGKGKYVSCTVNPATGMEREFAIRPAERKKSVLVVGGGPGGMEAAGVAALRGHNVTLLEKANDLGGNLIPASVPDFKQDYRSLIDYLSTQIRKLGVKIKLNTEATPELIHKMEPEVVFVATGGTPIVPDIRGLDKKKAITAVDALLSSKRIGQKVAIIGGGVVGGETALYLAQRGKDVTVVEILSTVASDMFLPNRQHLLKLLADAKVTILTETRVLEITDRGLAIADRDGKRRNLVADTIVLAVGLRPNNELAEALKGTVPELYAIGDCVEPRKVLSAVWEGFRTARLV